jgi:hypothetical protein
MSLGSTAAERYWKPQAGKEGTPQPSTTRATSDWMSDGHRVPNHTTPFDDIALKEYG